MKSRWTVFRIVGLIGALAWLTFGCVSRPAFTDPLAPYGLHYTLHLATEPRPLRVHVLRVDLSNPRIAIRSVIAPDPDGPGPANAALLDPRDMVKGKPVVAFVNANPWDAIPDASGQRQRQWAVGQPVEITGLAASNGEIRSPPHPRLASIWLDGRGRVHMDPPPNPTPISGKAGGASSVFSATGTFSPKTTIGSIR